MHGALGSRVPEHGRHAPVGCVRAGQSSETEVGDVADDLEWRSDDDTRAG